jgi:hypothetical protein
LTPFAPWFCCSLTLGQLPGVPQGGLQVGGEHCGEEPRQVQHTGRGDPGGEAALCGVQAVAQSEFTMKGPEKRKTPPSQEQFANLVMDRLREARLPGEISYDPDEFQISVALGENEPRAVLFLSNGYREYCSVSEGDRPQVLRRFVRGWLDARKETPEEFADVQHDLLPALRSRGLFESSRLQARIGGDDTISWPHHVVADDLGLGLVYDLPDAMRSISNRELEAWSTTLYEALEVARENLRRLRPRIIGPQEGEGIYVFTTNDGYDSSRLILLDLIRQFQVKGDYIAMAPGRETLIVAGSDDEPGLRAMLAVAKDVLQKPRPVSGVALRLDGEEWVSWLPKPDHPLYDEFWLLRLHTSHNDYAEQKDLLDRLYEKTGEDTFVASFTILRDKETGQYLNFCTWKQGARSLLPRTERIVLGADGREPILVAWQKVMEVAGHLLKPMEMYPERYLVEEFPTAEQLAAMGNELEDR